MSDRIAVVTGVSKGLGASLAVALLERGFEVIGVGRRADARLVGERFRLVEADLAEVERLPAILDPLFDELAARTPAAISVWNNAAVAAPIGVVGALDGEPLDRSLAVNLQAPILVANAFARAFAGVGGDRRLINVSSGAAVSALAGGGLYCIAKAGLEMLTQVVAAEQGADGIRAVTIRPGIIDTPMQTFMRAQPRERMPVVDLFVGFHADGQLVPPDVTAATLVDALVLAPVESGRTYSYSQLAAGD